MLLLVDGFVYKVNTAKNATLEKRRSNDMKRALYLNESIMDFRNIQVRSHFIETFVLSF